MLTRTRMTWGQGTLLSVTEAGAAVAGLGLRASRAPAPTWWAHHTGCGWTAAWLTLREREFQGPVEIEDDPQWSGELEWLERGQRRTSGHRPDLAYRAKGEKRYAVEVELARKSDRRVGAILGLYAKWRADRTINGLIYVCANEQVRARIRKLAGEHGLGDGDGKSGLRLETLETIQQHARDAAREARAAGG